MHKQYFFEQARYDRVVRQQNKKLLSGNGVFDRYKYPVLTREHIPVFWRYDLNEATNPYFLERLGVNATFNAGAIEIAGRSLTENHFLLWLRAKVRWKVLNFGITQCSCLIHAKRKQTFMICG